MWNFPYSNIFVKIKPVLRKKNGSIFSVKITPVCQDNPCQDTANTGVYHPSNQSGQISAKSENSEKSI